MGLTSAPATESIMGAVSRRQAGVGSAVNDRARRVGGTLGVAVIGSVYASLYGSRLTALLPAGLPEPVKAIAHQSLGAAYAVSGRVPGALGRAVHDAATNAFLHGLSVGCLVAGGVAAAGAILAVMFLPAQPASPAMAWPWPVAPEARPRLTAMAPRIAASRPPGRASGNMTKDNAATRLATPRTRAATPRPFPGRADGGATNGGGDPGTCVSM